MASPFPWVQARGRSQVETAKMCSAWLAQELRLAGATRPEAELERVCRVPVHWVKRWYDEAFTVWQASQRRGQWSATGVALLTRTPPARPFAEVELDGHVVDIGSKDRRAIAVTALDRASGHLWAHLFILPWTKGSKKALTQRHAATALARFFCEPGGCGVPGMLIPDQGGEFKNLGFGMGELKKLALAQGLDFAVRPAAAYNPQGKGRLERAHAALEGGLALLPGHTGGDWANRATKAPGKDIDPYPGDEAALRADFDRAVEAPNNKRPAPGKPSAREQLEAQCRETGAAARIIDRDAFDLCLYEEEINPQVSGTVEVDGRKVGLDWLCDHPGPKRVTVRKPLRFVPEGELLRAWAVHGGRLHELHEERVETMDPAGVRRIEAARAAQAAALAALAAQGAEPTGALGDYIATLPSTGPAAIPVETWTLTPPAEELPAEAEDMAEAEDDAELRWNFEKNTYGASAYSTTQLATACGE